MSDSDPCDPKAFSRDFTPIQEELVQVYGMSVALVFGKIWRYAQSKGFCYASQQTLAKELGISVDTVARAIDILLGEHEPTKTNRKTKKVEILPVIKFIVDVTPDHFYSKKQVRLYSPIMDNFYEFIDEQQSKNKKDNPKLDENYIKALASDRVKNATIKKISSSS